MPHQCIVLCDKDISLAITIEINEPEIGIAHIPIDARPKWLERTPAFTVIMFEQPRHRTIENNDIGLPVAREIKELRVSSIDRTIGNRCNPLKRRKLDWLRACRADIPFVKPGSTLLCQNSRNALAMQVGPQVIVPFNTC